MNTLANKYLQIIKKYITFEKMAFPGLDGAPPLQRLRAGQPNRL